MAISEKAKRYSFLVDTPIGVLGVLTENNRLLCIDFLAGKKRITKPVTAFDRKVARQLSSYFKNPQFRFTLALDDSATAFQARLRKQLLRVSPGKPETYGSMARRLGSAPRAVGAALRANPVPIVVPCHRVVAATDTGGFSGQRTGRLPAIKRWLLRHEQV